MEGLEKKREDKGGRECWEDGAKGENEGEGEKHKDTSLCKLKHKKAKTQVRGLGWRESNC